MMDSPAESQSMLPGRPAALEPIATDNPYIFGNPELDRLRLETQDRLIGERMQARARALVGDNVRNILDLGCGEGQLGLRLLEVYPAAHLVGLDKDPKAITTAEARARVAGAQARYEVGDVEGNARWPLRSDLCFVDPAAYPPGAPGDCPYLGRHAPRRGLLGHRISS